MKRWTIWLLPTLVGATALLATGWLWQHERQVQTRELRRNFDVGLRQAAHQLQRVAANARERRADAVGAQNEINGHRMSAAKSGCCWRTAISVFKAHDIVFT